MAKQFQVFDIGNDVFTMAVEISDQHVLKSKYFDKDDRIFLRDNIRTRRIEIASNENIQLYVKTVYDMETQQN